MLKVKFLKIVVPGPVTCSVTHRISMSVWLLSSTKLKRIIIFITLD